MTTARKYVEDFNISEGFAFGWQELYETLKDEKEIYRKNLTSRRHWDEAFVVVNLKGRLIGFTDANTTGDESPSERGWEFDPDSICDVDAKEITTTKYTRKAAE